MPSDKKRIALAVTAALAAACSNMPRTAEPAPSTAAHSKPAPQTIAAASDIDLSLVKAGYSVMRRHDQVFYCRNEIITGNRIGTRVCLTAAQIQDEMRDVTNAKDVINKPNNRCLGPECK